MFRECSGPAAVIEPGGTERHGRQATAIEPDGRARCVSHQHAAPMFMSRYIITYQIKLELPHLTHTSSGFEPPGRLAPRSPARKGPDASETDGRRCTEGPAEIIGEMRVVRKSGRMGGYCKIAPGHDLTYGRAHPAPSAVATKGHAGFSSEHALKGTLTGLRSLRGA